MNRPNRRSGNADLRITGRLGVAQRLRIRERDGYRCRCCNRAVRVGQIDHIVPLDKGGSNDDSNMQLLCDDCHVDKTNRDNGYKVRRLVDINRIPEGW
ncbi:HNH endonuclease [Paraburkholderia sp. SARCC-3016]|uniref:HNH endonuclease n=1 Tax=Paraburkholderia sp. SARCC-3016 TaxID=3058611 RepID=UPI00280688CF|nr:HNH endonuclease [Paraburkholderia sp. SARCC-3016]MDQ7982174.1 HNH endonuclease [Paraburkholderia sp. SARCC-3016]